MLHVLLVGEQGIRICRIRVHQIEVRLRLGVLAVLRGKQGRAGRRLLQVMMIVILALCRVFILLEIDFFA